MYAEDVAALTAFGFDAVKLDGCGKERRDLQFLLSPEGSSIPIGRKWYFAGLSVWGLESRV